MKILVIGGDRHGEWVDGLPDSVQVWVDITHAAQHRIRNLTWMIQDVKTGQVTESYEIRIGVHEALLGPDEPTVVTELVRMLTMNEFARAHGDPQEVTQEPAGKDLIIPGKDKV